jgi:hypothetical protein
MSLSEKLNSAIQESSIKACKIGLLLVGKELTEKDKQNLIVILDADPKDPSRVPNTTLGKILREEGYDISNSAVDRHRRADCACHRLDKK